MILPTWQSYACFTDEPERIRRMVNQLLLEPFQLGDLNLKNRMVMAPMTRNRAGEGNIQGDLNATYYRQRSGAGLIITEASQVAPHGQGYPYTPGIHNLDQVEGGKKITRAVHDAEGKIFLQLWHVGRISHPDFQQGKPPLAPSAIKPKGQVYTFEGLKDFVTPRALETQEIQDVVADYQKGARLAREAGFDGVEIHGANGYLIDQFLQDISNHRTDWYGGSIENRTRFLLEVVQAVREEWPSNRVGLRLSPSGEFNTMGDSHSRELFTYVIQQLNAFDLAYIHLIRAGDVADKPHLEGDVIGYYGPQIETTVIASTGYDRETGNEELQKGIADLIAFGRPFLANPDLPERFERKAPLNEPDSSTFYGGGEKGYTDYPFLKEEEPASK
jgi:N-ethylmaleimide reductase